MLNFIMHSIELLNLILILFVLFFERKDSSKRIAWLLALLFLPGIGIVFYLLFSGHFFTGGRRMKHVSSISKNFFRKYIDDELDFLKQHSDELDNTVVQENLPLIGMNIRNSSSLLVSTDSVDIYPQGAEFFEQVCRELEEAKKSIYMEYFIFHSDKIGKRIMDILCRKAREGVEVKLIYDDLGSILTMRHFFRKLNRAGGEARPFFPIKLGLPITLNYRDHRKVTLIDDRVAFVGGVNIGDEYANWKKHNRHFWRDTVVRVTGYSVLDIQAHFLIDWYFLDAWNNRSRTRKETSDYFPKNLMENMTSDSYSQFFGSGKIPTQVVVSGPDDFAKRNIEDALIKMITQAKKTVYIQSPYFTPNDEFVSALKIAAYSGVDVRIMIPRDWDKFFVKAASFEFVRETLDYGIKFYMYPGFIHAKTISVDSEVCSIGTTNIDERSFCLHYEENLFFYDRETTLKSEKIFHDDLAVSQQVTQEFFNKKLFIRRIVWSFFKLFSPLM